MDNFSRFRLATIVAICVLSGCGREQPAPAPAPQPPAPVADSRPITTKVVEPPATLKITEHEVLDALNKHRAKLAFSHTSDGVIGGEPYHSYAAETLPVTLDICFAPDGKITSIDFIVRLADFVALSTVNKKVDRETVEGHVTTLLKSVMAVAAVEDIFVEKQYDEVEMELLACLAGNSEGGTHPGESARVSVVRLVDVKLAVMYVSLMPLEP